MKRIMDIKFHCSEDEHFTKKEPLFRAFSFQNYYIEPHAHDFYEMNIVLSGSGIHQIEAVKLSVSAGDVFVIPPMTAHAYYNTENLEVFHIIFKKDFIISNHSEAITVPGFLQLMEIEPFLRQNCSEAMFLHLTPSQLSQIRLDLKIIEDESKIENITSVQKPVSDISVGNTVTRYIVKNRVHTRSLVITSKRPCESIYCLKMSLLPTTIFPRLLLCVFNQSTSRCNCICFLRISFLLFI